MKASLLRISQAFGSLQHAGDDVAARCRIRALHSYELSVLLDLCCISGAVTAAQSPSNLSGSPLKSVRICAPYNTPQSLYRMGSISVKLSKIGTVWGRLLHATRQQPHFSRYGTLPDSMLCPGDTAQQARQQDRRNGGRTSGCNRHDDRADAWANPCGIWRPPTARCSLIQGIDAVQFTTYSSGTWVEAETRQRQGAGHAKSPGTAATRAAGAMRLSNKGRWATAPDGAALPIGGTEQELEA